MWLNMLSSGSVKSPGSGPRVLFVYVVNVYGRLDTVNATTKKTSIIHHVVTLSLYAYVKMMQCKCFMLLTRFGY